MDKKALFLGFEAIAGKEARPLNTNTAIAICSELIDKQVDVRKVTGTNLKNQRPGVFHIYGSQFEFAYL